MFNNGNNIDIILIITNILLFTSCLTITILYILKLNKLNKTIISLKAANLRNQSLQTSYDSIRTFKHDFFNIMQSIGGYIKSGNMDCLRDFYNEINIECNNLNNNLPLLSSELLDDTAIYNLIMTKYQKAKTLDISFSMQCLIKLSSINAKPYTISRILGILLDNAIEAAKDTPDKKIIFEIRPVPCFDTSKQIANIVIENSYSNKDIDINKICEKGFTSKPQDSRLTRPRFVECFENYSKI